MDCSHIQIWRNSILIFCYVYVASPCNDAIRRCCVDVVLMYSSHIDTLSILNQREYTRSVSQFFQTIAHSTKEGFLIDFWMSFGNKRWRKCKTPSTIPNKLFWWPYFEAAMDRFHFSIVSNLVLLVEDLSKITEARWGTHNWNAMGPVFKIGCYKYLIVHSIEPHFQLSSKLGTKLIWGVGFSPNKKIQGLLTQVSKSKCQ